LTLQLPIGLLYQPWIKDEWIKTSGRIINEVGKLTYLEENLYHCHFINHLFHMNWSMIKPRTLR
jgi:hypothetical protein